MPTQGIRSGFSGAPQAAARGFDHDGLGRSMMHFDYDNDGDQDVVIMSYGGVLSLFRNDLTGTRAWLRIFLDTSGDAANPPGGIGARAIVTVGGVSRIAVVDTGDTYLGSNEPSAHFGLGEVAVVDEIRVEWTDGSVTTLPDVPANQTLTIPSVPSETRRGTAPSRRRP